MAIGIVFMNLRSGYAAGDLSAYLFGSIITVTRGDDMITLPKKEFYLLFKLLSSPRQIFTRRQLMDEIWGLDAQSDERTVDVHIKRLRGKCEIFPDFTLETVRGLGYKAVKTDG